MAISPTSSSTAAGRVAIKSATDRPGSAAAEVEKEMRERLVSIQKEREQTENELRKNIDYIREDYQKQSSLESARQDSSLEEQRTKGYEKIRALQRQQQSELALVKKEGEKQLSETTEHYRDAINTKTVSGQQELKKLTDKQNSDFEYRTRSHALATEDMKKTQEAQAARLHDEYQGRSAQQLKAYNDEAERIRSTLEQAHEKQAERMTDKQSHIQSTLDQELNNINERAAGHIKELRDSTAVKLSAYADRKNDPFYRMVEIQANVYDEGDHYVLRAPIPEHENNNLSVTMRGNSLVVAGNRKNEDRVEVEPGHIKNTSSYQSFSEIIPLPWPVEAKQLSKKIRDGELIASVPKVTHLSAEPHKAPPIDRKIASRPVWPDNLKISAEGLKASRDAKELEEDQATENRGNRALTKWKSLT